MIVWVIVAGLTGIAAGLFLGRKRETLYLQEIEWTLEEILSGQQAQRFRMRTSKHQLQEICRHLNLLLDRYQEHVRQVEYLEASRKKMVSNMSHDLQTPLAAMLGYVEALQTDLSLSEEDQRRFLNVIGKKGEQLSGLFREFFELAKVEADDTLLRRVPVDVSEAVEDIVSAFAWECERNGVELEVEMPQEIVRVLGEPRFIERILGNLISNSLRYGKQGGVIGILAYCEGKWVWIKVWDRGPGIPAKDLPHVFDRLYTGEASRNTAKQGHGLGLTIVKKLVEKQGGKVQVKSVLGEWTEFAFSLPRME